MNERDLALIMTVLRVLGKPASVEIVEGAFANSLAEIADYRRHPPKPHRESEPDDSSTDPTW